MKNKNEILSPESTYHIYNRANGNEKMFLSDENYRFFIQKYREHISPFADTFCYCLMPNHFHFLIRIKTEVELKKTFSKFKIETETFPKFKTETETFPKFKTLEKLLSKQFSNFFSSYTQAFNKQQNRMGSLFMKNFKRIKVTEQRYLLNLVRYIHYNPVVSSLTSKPTEWPHSSYFSIIADKPTFLKKEEVIEWFNDKENFMHFHSHFPKMDKQITTEL